MNFESVYLKEELKLNSGNDRLNILFRDYLSKIFSPLYLKKIDKIIKDSLVLKEFKENNNVMAYTIGTKIFVNKEKFLSLPIDRAMVYIIHELFHVLDNMKSFKEISFINQKLSAAAEKYIQKKDMSTFLTGKQQDIHSNYKDEFLSYMSNNVFNWNLAPELKEEFKKIIVKSNIFNINSDWWKKRLN